MAHIEVPLLPSGSMVVISSESPVGLVATRLPDDVPVIAVFNNFMSPDRCTRLQIRAGQRLLAHQGPLWLLRDNGAGDDQGERLLARSYGLKSGKNCYPFTASGSELRLCQLHRKQTMVGCIAPLARRDKRGR